ncbi:DUF4331 family protein [Pseudenhygromyxa sp. WMMC2535]|uniref:DUF4331 family protein n=1 Tax=Pseudenhygromyxa sp. WMMC2535 TaxID=2712867 RepID=UPI0015547307|nr:DUF4331 family protein [Pseudenhygromyxa sp. WMMC2535]NVB36700.1 DUF4331 family protein [Pseudenhygromyxa sp. WMMC2535]
MTQRKTFLKYGLAAGALVAFVAGSLVTTGVLASDHAEAPGTMTDAEADISDFYAWYTGENIVVAATFNGLQEAGAELELDTAVLYSFHFDVDGDNVSDHDIHCRFGDNGEGRYGIQVSDLPGVGTVEVDLPDLEDAGYDVGGAMVFAGQRDDPFFFDLDGYAETLDTEELMLDPENDSFAGTNADAIVLEFSAAELLGDATSFQTWVTTARLP